MQLGFTLPALVKTMHPHERLVLKALSAKPIPLESLARHTGLQVDSARRACHLLKEKGLADLSEEEKEAHAASEEGLRFLKEKFPEQRVLEKARKAAPLDSLSDEEKRIGLPWALKSKWASLSEKDGKKTLSLTPEGAQALSHPSPLHSLLQKIAEGEKIPAGQEEALSLLEKRGLAAKKRLSIFSARATPEGEKAAKRLGEEGEEVRSLSKNLITSGAWKGARLQEYNVTAPGETLCPGKPHPLRLLMEKIRRVFLDMGFEEMKGPCVESSFWNFDALFQPQDHPARDLQDTFYLKHPRELPLPDRPLVDRVRNAHEKGWKYEWLEEKAKQAVLRTHTTAVSARYLADIRAGKRSPGKYFAIGRVYRNEATDFKHLAEFHQVEGIVAWEKASFRHLLGLLKQFYSKLGFEQIRFRPSYFPYTEPSLEIDAFFKEKNAWIELGGAGVFRPEVCLPLWGKYPVLAFGLSLERPLMLATGLKDIRTIYRNDISWLRNSRLGD